MDKIKAWHYATRMMHQESVENKYQRAYYSQLFCYYVYIQSYILGTCYGTKNLIPIWDDKIRLFVCALLRLPTDPKSIHKPEFFEKYLSFLEGVLSKVSWKFTKTRVFPEKPEFFRANLSFFRTWVFSKMHKKKSLD